MKEDGYDCTSCFPQEGGKIQFLKYFSITQLLALIYKNMPFPIGLNSQHYNFIKELIIPTHIQ